MRGLRLLALFTTALALSVGVAAAQSLAEIAKKEKERRDANKSENKKVITERELARSYGGLPTTLPQQASPSTEEGGEAGTEPTGDESDSEEPVDETKTLEYWQNRVRGAKEKIARAEERLSSEDWGEGQRVGVDPLGQTNLGSRQQTEQQLAAARAELEAIRAEARRAGVPPGWVR